MTMREIWNEYSYELDNSDINFLDRELDGVLPFDDYQAFLDIFHKHLKYMDCTRTISNGMRIIQTINEPYKWELARCVYIVNWVKDYNKELWEKCYDEIVKQHEDNLEFEKTTPPIIYDKLKPKKNTTRKRKYKEADMFPEETKKAKISKAEAKLKAKLLGSSIGFGSFKIKKD